MLCINERIKEVRESNALSQDAFGARIKITRSSVSLLESGKNNPSDQTILLICREFNINEQWLRTGDGSMFVETDGTAWARFTSEYGLNDMEQAFLHVYVTLPPEHRRVVCDLVRRVSSACANPNDPALELERAAALVDRKLDEQGM